ncbi:Bug family tripartite tricarboxylate transporter substrate binding protein [Paracoccus seriniphilus]|uniref:Bug family tripartite tricarboxylate transporter substrate binding protein n=1 Tax=Paracoccus seriniphilus TaxID=184748 RepID=UPI003567B322
MSKIAMPGVSRRAFTIGAGVALAGGVLSGGQVMAQTFPSRPIKICVPFKPGGRTDLVARMLAEKIKENDWLPQPIAIVNADGGAGANAVNMMKRDPADGHTILHWQHQLLIAIAMELGNFSLDRFKSIGYTGGGSPIWAVHEDSPYQTLDELTAYLKDNPRGLVEAVGIGTIPHFVGAMLAQSAGFETRYVTANSGSDRLRLILGGNADIALFAASEYLSQGENLRPLVYFGTERLAQMPDVPTATELGYDVTWANPNWWLAPADTPDEHVAAIGAALEKAIADPEIVQYFEENTLEAYWMNGEDSMADARQTLEQLKSIAATIG